MALDKDFEICIRYAIVKSDGTEINLPNNYIRVDRIDDTEYILVYYRDKADKVIYGVIDSGGSIILDGYDMINFIFEKDDIGWVDPGHERTRYLILEKGSSSSLWGAQEGRKLLGGKSFVRISAWEVAHSLVPVMVRDKRAQNGVFYQLVDINTGKAVSPRYDSISLDFDYQRFYVLGKRGKRPKVCLFDSITHMMIDCGDVSSRNNNQKPAKIEFSRDFALAIGDKKSKIVSGIIGGVVVDELSPKARYWQRSGEQNIFFDPSWKMGRWYKLIPNDDNDEPSVVVIEYRESKRDKHKPVIEKVKLIDHLGRVRFVKKDIFRQKIPNYIY